jgi:Flp pilus assembly protein TadG
MIALIGGSIQLGVIYFAKTELNRITQDAARQALLGASQYMTQAQFNTAICADVSAMFTCSGLLVSLTPQTNCATITAMAPTLTYDANGNVTNNFGYNGGANGQIMVLQISYQLPVIGGSLFTFATQPNGSLLLTSTAVFMNEP